MTHPKNSAEKKSTLQQSTIRPAESASQDFEQRGVATVRSAAEARPWPADPTVLIPLKAGMVCGWDLNSNSGQAKVRGKPWNIWKVVQSWEDLVFFSCSQLSSCFFHHTFPYHVVALFPCCRLNFDFVRLVYYLSCILKYGQSIYKGKHILIWSGQEVPSTPTNRVGKSKALILVLLLKYVLRIQVCHST